LSPSFQQITELNRAFNVPLAAGLLQQFIQCIGSREIAFCLAEHVKLAFRLKHAWFHRNMVLAVSYLWILYCTAAFALPIWPL